MSCHNSRSGKSKRRTTVTPSFPSQRPSVLRGPKAPAMRQRSPSAYVSGPRPDEGARGAGHWTHFLRSVMSPVNARSTFCSVSPVSMASCSKMSHVNLGKMPPGVSWQLTVTAQNHQGRADLGAGNARVRL